MKDTTILLIDPRTGEQVLWDSLDDWMDAGGDVDALRREAIAHGDRDMVDCIRRWEETT